MKALNLGLVLVDYGPKRLEKQTDRLTLIVTGSNVPTWQAQCCIDRGTLLRRSRSGSEWHGKPKIKKDDNIYKYKTQQIRKAIKNNIDKYAVTAHKILQNKISEIFYVNYVIKELKRILDMDILTFFDLDIELNLLRNVKVSKINILKMDYRVA